MLDSLSYSPVKVLDNLDSRYYIVRMDANTFKLYWFDQYDTWKTPYEITEQSLQEAYKAKEYDSPEEALSQLKK